MNKNDKPQGIPDELFRVCAESRSARIGTMQFGVSVCDRYDVLVFTDDAGCVPHIHIVDTMTKGTRFNCCVELAANCYYAHNGNIVFLDDRHCRQLNGFMHQPCRNVHYRNNYEYAVDMWNINNPDFAMQISEDASGEIVVPDYTTILLTEHNNNKYD